MPCIVPYNVERAIYHNQEDRYVSVPCGKCPPCLEARSSRWSFRLRKEEERSRSSYFITLTYDPEFVPVTKNKFMTLQFSDVQKFFKRLRKRHSMRNTGYPIRYYCAGEYGTKNRRPHYHCIIFNADLNDITSAWRHPDTKQPLGYVDIGYDCSGAAIAYTLKYINKGQAVPEHKNDDRTPEKAIMSKGLGSNYLTPGTIRYHRENLHRAYNVLDGGIKIPLSRYYKDKLFPVSTGSLNLVRKHPTILLHFEENKALRKMQETFIKELLASKQLLNFRTDREKHESIRNLISNWKNFYKNKRQ